MWSRGGGVREERLGPNSKLLPAKPQTFPLSSSDLLVGITAYILMECEREIERDEVNAAVSHYPSPSLSRSLEARCLSSLAFRFSIAKVLREC